MAEIALTKGYVAVVDDADLGWLSRWRWHADVAGNTVYARRHLLADEDQTDGKSVSMHRAIAAAPREKLVDHRDRNGLNNRRKNLRVCSHGENSRNCVKPVGRSGYRGVLWDGERNLWRPELWIAGRKIRGGRFACPVEAAHARDELAIKYHGAFARLNFPDEVAV